MHTPIQTRIHGLHHIAIQVADFEASLRFYCDGLGCRPIVEFEEDGARVALLELGAGTYLELFSGGTRAAAQGPLLHLALRTDDCDAALARASAAGATITLEPGDALLGSAPGLAVRYAFCRGPDGEEIEFLQSEQL